MKFSRLKMEWPLHLLILPGLILVIIYNYIPMLGLVMAFQKFIPALGITGSKWIGLDNFRYLLDLPNIWQVLWNTVYIAVMKIIVGLIVPIHHGLSLEFVVRRDDLHEQNLQLSALHLPAECVDQRLDHQQHGQSE
jgi:ABC-type polysaccharide transport system, permease component